MNIKDIVDCLVENGFVEETGTGEYGERIFEFTKLGKLFKEPEGLSYENVSVVPKLNLIDSRSKVKLTTNFSRNIQIPTPKVAANMQCVTNASFIIELWRYGVLGILHRFYTHEKLYQEVDRIVTAGIPAVTSCGVKKSDLHFVEECLKRGARGVVVDIAHGHSSMMKDMAKSLHGLKSKYKFDIILGNICTKDSVEYLAEYADGLKVGVSNGCFVSGTMVTTEYGEKPIEQINIGDKVLTHKCRFMPVVNTLARPEKNKVYKINGIECTGNHEFYVVQKKYKDVINDDNVNEYAEWVQAADLTKDYLLLKIKKE